MSAQGVCVVFLLFQLVCISVHGTAPYGGDSNGHAGKKGPDNRYTDHRSRTSNSRTCYDSFVDKSNYIIRTKESLENNAIFIDAIKVGTSSTCVSRCCDEQDVIDDDGKTVSCDASVFVKGDDAFENKESNCFLFQCRFDFGERNRCRFSNHDGYVSNMVGGFGREPEFHDDRPVEEEEEEEIPQTKAAPPATTQWKEEDKHTDVVKDGCDNDALFQCGNGQCIRSSLLCDNYRDCSFFPDGCDSDALFQCGNGQCIRSSLLCDKYQDCDDNSDEDPERCEVLEEYTDQGEAFQDENENKPAKAPPTNPPKLPTTNNEQRPRPATTYAPSTSDGDDTIFRSELASQLHKEGAKQKQRGKSDDDEDSRQRGDWNRRPDDDDWNDGHDDDLPPSRQDNDDWRPRNNQGRPYGTNFDRPYQQDRYDDNDADDYRDYQRRPGNNNGNDRDEDNDREPYDSKYRGGGDRYQPNSGRYRPDTEDKQDDSRHEYSKEDGGTEDTDTRDEQQSEPTTKDKWDNRNDDTSPDTTNDSDQQDKTSKANGESTKEDWYGKHQPDKDSPPPPPANSNNRFPPDHEDYDNKNDYHDYFGNYYDRNRGYPRNRFDNNYRYPYGPGGDYPNYVDYPGNQGNRNPGGRWGGGGRGRGNGNGRWNQVQNRYSEGGHDVVEEPQDGDGSVEVDPDKLQGEDAGKANSADVPHSRRLRPGLWKIWRYMYGSSAADYTTEYPPVAPPGDGGDNEIDQADDDDNKSTEDDGDTDNDEDKDDQSKGENLPTAGVIVNKNNKDNGDITNKPAETQKSASPDQSSSQNKNNSKTDDKPPSKTLSSSANHHNDVRVVEKQGVTATAVLPLTIGLFLTLFLLLMMSCRLRYMNQRLRYGRLKTNNAHDADYLINGMYL